MIEDKSQLIAEFIQLGTRYRDSQDLMAALALDDTIVKLKRFVLTEMRDQELASELGLLPKLIRRRDIEGYREAFDRIARQLA